MRGCKSEVHKKMHQTNKEKSEDNRYGIGKNHWKTVLSTVSDDPLAHMRAWHLLQPLCTSLQLQSCGMAFPLIMQVFNEFLPYGHLINILLLAAIFLPSSSNRCSKGLRLGITAFTAGL